MRPGWKTLQKAEIVPLPEQPVFEDVSSFSYGERPITQGFAALIREKF